MAGLGRKKFHMNWNETYQWIKKLDEDYALCRACKTKLKYSTAGKATLEQHLRSGKHMKSMKTWLPESTESPPSERGVTRKFSSLHHSAPMEYHKKMARIGLERSGIERKQYTEVSEDDEAENTNECQVPVLPHSSKEDSEHTSKRLSSSKIYSSTSSGLSLNSTPSLAKLIPAKIQSRRNSSSIEETSMHEYSSPPDSPAQSVASSHEIRMSDSSTPSNLQDERLCDSVPSTSSESQSIEQAGTSKDVVDSIFLCMQRAKQIYDENTRAILAELENYLKKWVLENPCDLGDVSFLENNLSNVEGGADVINALKVLYALNA